MSSPRGGVSVSRALILIALQILLVFVIGFRLIAPTMFGDGNLFDPRPAAFGFVIAVAVVGFVALVWFGSVKQPQRTWSELGWRWDDPARHIGVGLVAAVVCLGSEILVLLALGMTPGEVVEAITDVSLPQRLLFLVIGIQAAVIEESLFRGNLVDALRTKMSAIAAIGLAAVIFALYHLQPNPVGLVVKTWFGVVFTIARLRGGSLVSPAIAHVSTWVVLGAM